MTLCPLLIWSEFFQLSLRNYLPIMDNIKVTEEAMEDIKVILHEDFPGTVFSHDDYYLIALAWLKLVYAVYRDLPMHEELPVIEY